MHHFIYPSKTSWISSGSNKRTSGITQTDQNFGKDEILELKKEFFNNTFDYPSRILLQFSGDEFNEVSNSMAGQNIDYRRPNVIDTQAKFFLRLYEAEGNNATAPSYSIAVYPLSQSWEEGTGKFVNSPKVTNGCSWQYRFNPLNSTTATNTLTWSRAGEDAAGKLLEATDGQGFISSSGNFSTQDFSNSESPDINLEVSSIVRKHLTSSNPGTIINPHVNYQNNGLLLRISGSQETDDTTYANLKFFSRHTNTIFAPRLEVKWDDHTIITGSATGSLTQLTMSGEVDNLIYPIGLRKEYRETEEVKFRFAGRKRYIQKSFTTSVQQVTGSFIPEGSGSYSIIDLGTAETIVPFSPFTSMSCDSTSNYFNQKLSGFYPDRFYKILVKVNYDDGQEIIYDDDFEFKVVR